VRMFTHFSCTCCTLPQEGETKTMDQLFHKA
jgi:hypothetical protein